MCGIEVVFLVDVFCLFIKREFINCVIGVGLLVVVIFFVDCVKIFDFVLFVLNFVGVFLNVFLMSLLREFNLERDIMLSVDAMFGNVFGVNLNVFIFVVGGGILLYKLVLVFLLLGVYKEGRLVVFSVLFKIFCAVRYSGVSNIFVNGFALVSVVFLFGGVFRGDGMIVFN